MAATWMIQHIFKGCVHTVHCVVQGRQADFITISHSRSLFFWPEMIQIQCEMQQLSIINNTLKIDKYLDRIKSVLPTADKSVIIQPPTLFCDPE